MRLIYKINGETVTPKEPQVEICMDFGKEGDMSAETEFTYNDDAVNIIKAHINSESPPCVKRD